MQLLRGIRKRRRRRCSTEGTESFENADCIFRPPKTGCVTFPFRWLLFSMSLVVCTAAGTAFILREEVDQGGSQELSARRRKRAGHSAMKSGGTDEKEEHQNQRFPKKTPPEEKEQGAQLHYCTWLQVLTLVHTFTHCVCVNYFPQSSPTAM